MTSLAVVCLMFALAHFCEKWQNILASSSPLKRAIASVMPSDKNTVRGSAWGLLSSTIQKA
jgi:hypothetical protein